ncbi:MutS-related protein [Pseudobacter ginsenosidimutans]|uniref:MutS-like protein n=1 Tax=Pseudobacter ginsenosidimutans TaxID=661488 RepID=A0A4Q7N2L6_9BACT|nr:DNA mismatch repair protein [Pseudobacter ginsenosidimutans]QEC42922.1 DNA mismatch repair protein [Pseudobacter ginsenosidimutans]RZS74275.1 MutS-like protein [Pseudobacter ginsenosidimutans]
MYLQTDEQTIDDLRIFGKRDSTGVFELYNRVHTRGGESLLKEMFRAPLSDQDLINARSSIIQHFAGNKTGFPFNASIFDMAEKYMHSANETRSQGSDKAVLSEKEISNGVTALIEMMQLCRAFIESENVKKIDAYRSERESIAMILSDSAFTPLHKENLRAKISYSAVAAYDVLFRVREQQKVNRLMAHIYYLDVLLSIAAIANERNFIFPKALEKGSATLLLEGVYHPELKSPVANDLTLNNNRNFIFLTGANMAGKSTFLRSVSVAMFLAHMGFPVAAKKMEFSVMDGIYTTINLPDNLGIGASHFYAEVLRVKQVAAELGKNKSLFVIFDELFRGTNVKDAHEASVAVSLSFAKRKNSMFIISSHIIEAGEELKQLNNIGFLFLPTRMNGHMPEYTYRLEKGITDDRHGMIIILNEGILEILEKGKKKKNLCHSI